MLDVQVALLRGKFGNVEVAENSKDLELEDLSSSSYKALVPEVTQA